MRLNRLSSTSFKGMLMLQDHKRNKYSVNPKAIASVENIDPHAGANYGKSTKIGLINGEVYYATASYDKVMIGIKQANKTTDNVCLF